jgi:hypothetical protein
MRWPRRTPIGVLRYAGPVGFMGVLALAALLGLPAPAVDFGKPPGAVGLRNAAATLNPAPGPRSYLEAPPQRPLPRLLPLAPGAGSRQLTLEFPSTIRTGDFGIIRLLLQADQANKTTAAPEIGGNTLTEWLAPTLKPYQKHTVIAQAEIDLAGTKILPAGPVSEPLLPGQSISFVWSVRPTEPATYRGTAWLFVVLVDTATGVETRRPVSAQSIQIEATSMLGLNGNTARVAGGLGSVLGIALGFPFAGGLLEWLRLRSSTGH